MKVLKEHNFDISGATFDGGTVSALHWGITDAQGQSAIFEFDHGTIKVYEGEDMKAMTNGLCADTSLTAMLRKLPTPTSDSP